MLDYIFIDNPYSTGEQVAFYLTYDVCPFTYVLHIWSYVLPGYTAAIFYSFPPPQANDRAGRGSCEIWNGDCKVW